MWVCAQGEEETGFGNCFLTYSISRDISNILFSMKFSYASQGSMFCTCIMYKTNGIPETNYISKCAVVVTRYCNITSRN
jgi:hypothetical protein